MIIKFSVENFGPIKDEQILSFEAEKYTDLESYYITEPVEGLRLLKIGLIFGANASGKTSILKAVESLRDLILYATEKKTDKLSFNPFAFNSESQKKNTITTIDFIHNKIKYKYRVEYNADAIINEQLDFYNPTKANIYKRTTDLDNKFSKIDFGSKMKKSKVLKKALEENTIWNRTVLASYLKINFEFFELNEVIEWFRLYLRPLILTNTQLDDFVSELINNGDIEKDMVVEILKKADFNISDIIINEKEQEIPIAFIEFLHNQIKSEESKEQLEQLDELRDNRTIKTVDLKFEHTINGSKYSLPFKSQSQGTQRYYGFAGILSLLIQKSIFFSIDELESSLHPDLYIHFILSFLANSKNSQILATTHNREILNDRDLFRNDAIWFASKNNLGSVEIYSLSDFDSKTIRDTSNIYNAYRTGKLGASPRLFDYYIDIKDEKK